MLTAKDMVAAKGGQVYSIEREASVLQAAKLLSEKRIGAVVVAAGPKVVGIFTERDLVNRVVAAGLDPCQTIVGQVMTSPVVCCQPQTSKSECVKVMTERRIRHLPVVDHEELVGIISIGDILAQEVADQKSTIQYLHEYMFTQPR
ncbi:MAG TPA: CBS domain-containing protein [Phycisphaerae bacterium]|nr:CBS domain-containing protein [Phycisphaerae bacterium]